MQNGILIYLKKENIPTKWIKLGWVRSQGSTCKSLNCDVVILIKD